jgi:hypothetical protein
MQTAIASSSISPDMWTSIGPSSKNPLDGEGIEAITGRILPVCTGRVPGSDPGTSPAGTLQYVAATPKGRSSGGEPSLPAVAWGLTPGRGLEGQFRR